MTDTIERFSNRVANYVKYRPDYPREIIAYLEANRVMTHESLIADIGCGTGLSSRLFLENCNRVIGVEPNEAMRAAARMELAEFPDFTLVDGTSVNTGLENESVDLVVAAQAFHWFDPEGTRPEFKRILKPTGYVVLIWNERQLDSTQFLIEYENFLVRYAYDYGTVRHENIHAGELDAFFQTKYTTATFANVQVFDFDGLKGRMLSSSYMPNETDEVYPVMIEELKTLFAKHAENGRIKVFYDTKVHHSQL